MFAGDHIHYTFCTITGQYYPVVHKREGSEKIELALDLYLVKRRICTNDCPYQFHYSISKHFNLEIMCDFSKNFCLKMNFVLD